MSAAPNANVDAGLEKVVAAETILSDVDGANGRLIIRGHDVGDLAARFTFEQAAALLWSGFFMLEPDAEPPRPPAWRRPRRRFPAP